MKAFVNFLLLVAAAIPADAQPFDCKKNLDTAFALVSENYSGVEDKVVPRQNIYNRLVDSLYRKASLATRDECYQLLTAYVGFFADHHLSVSQHQPVSFFAADSVRLSNHEVKKFLNGAAN